MASDSVTYEYDGAGQRTRKVGLSDTTRYTWDGLYPVVEWNNQGKLKQTFVYANGLLLGLIDSTLYTNRRFFVLHDGLGSSISMTNDSARIVRSLIYSDFGQSLVDTSAANTPSLNRLYAGYSWDGSPANFYWMKYRQSFDPIIGRFEQEDLLVRGLIPVDYRTTPPKINPYIYVINAPINFIDPDGLETPLTGNFKLDQCLKQADDEYKKCLLRVRLTGYGTAGATVCVSAAFIIFAPETTPAALRVGVPIFISCCAAEKTGELGCLLHKSQRQRECFLLFGTPKQ